MATAKTLVSKHSLAELREMAIDLGVPLEDVDEMGKADLAAEIVMLTAERHEAEATAVAEALQPDAPELPVTGETVKVALYVVVEVDVDALARHMGYAFTKREAITAVRQSLYVAATQAAYPDGILTPVSDNR